MRFKLLRIYFIPILVIIVAMGVYFFVFLGIKNDILPKTQRLHHDNLQQLQDPIDSLFAFLGIERDSNAQSTPTIKESPATSNPPASTSRPKEPQEQIAQIQPPQASEPAQVVEQALNTAQPSSQIKQDDEPKQQESKEYMRAFVQVSTAVVRSAPSTQSPSITALSSGKRIEVASFDDEWFEIKEPIGGYIAKRLVRVAESGAQQAQATPAQPRAEIPSDSNVYEVLANRVNVRSAPSTDAPIIASLSLGQTVRVSSFSDGWATITLDSGRKAYIVARAIRKV